MSYSKRLNNSYPAPPPPPPPRLIRPCGSMGGGKDFYWLCGFVSILIISCCFLVAQ